jgi:hypothetical protein
MIPLQFIFKIVDKVHKEVDEGLADAFATIHKAYITTQICDQQLGCSGYSYYTIFGSELVSWITHYPYSYIRLKWGLSGLKSGLIETDLSRIFYLAKTYTF